MATTFAQSPLQTSSRQQFLTPHSPPQQQRRLVSRQRFIQDFFTENNFRLFFGLVLDVLVRPWEKFVTTLKYSEVRSKHIPLGFGLTGFSLAPFGLTAIFEQS